MECSSQILLSDSVEQSVTIQEIHVFQPGVRRFAAGWNLDFFSNSGNKNLGIF